MTRSKANIRYKQVTRDEKIEMVVEQTRVKYPKWLRLVCYTEVIINNMKLAVSAIAAIYKSRRQIETFFRWFKQNLKIKSFPGTGLNAVLTRIWVARCCFLLLSVSNSGRNTAIHCRT